MMSAEQEELTQAARVLRDARYAYMSMFSRHAGLPAEQFADEFDRVIAQVKADAWDKGESAGAENAIRKFINENPYRKATS